MLVCVNMECCLQIRTLEGQYLVALELLLVLRALLLVFRPLDTNPLPPTSTCLMIAKTFAPKLNLQQCPFMLRE